MTILVKMQISFSYFNFTNDAMSLVHVLQLRGTLLFTISIFMQKYANVMCNEMCNNNNSSLDPFAKGSSVLN